MYLTVLKRVCAHACLMPTKKCITFFLLLSLDKGDNKFKLTEEETRQPQLERVLYKEYNRGIT